MKVKGLITHQIKKKTTSKRNKFVKLAERRTINAIKAIRVIGKLSNRSSYEYYDDDIATIARALTQEIDALKTRMKRAGRTETIEFEL